jgi:hypothetical protein
MAGMRDSHPKAVGDRPAADVAGARTYRSPFAALVWWVWVLFALGNLIDLAVQGRDHFSVVAAFILVLVTGVVYVTAQRPRIIAGDDGLSILNPLRLHRVGWAAVAAVEATDLLRVRCEWPMDGAGDPAAKGSRVIYSWAMYSSRRRQVTAQMRVNRARRAQTAQPPVVDDVAPVAAALIARAEQARAAAHREQARPPVSTWCWPSLAAIAIPAVALVIAIAA